MGIEENKAVVVRFIETLSAGAPDLSLLCEDATWWVPGVGTVSREQFFKMAEAFAGRIKSPPKMTVGVITAEGDRVAMEAEAHAELTDGRFYDNTYHFLFHMRDGKILQAREHNNSQVPAALWGRSLQEG